ncbi:MAG TPA: gluconate 2-dehydrogenase subunit 3 family protein [Gemmatimonadaceae bacterium]|nr:gluconate 2-dehydrogenase subunit 3 family protein [Gemmatimonadaceae bacterium]
MTTRREVVQWLAGLPALAAAGRGTKLAERAAAHVAALAGGEAGAPYAPAWFNAHEWSTVRMLVDYIIPRDTRSGSATDAKVPEFMDYILADADTSDATRTAMRGGLAWLDLACVDHHGATFLRSTDAQRRAVLDLIAWPKKAAPAMSAGVAFFSSVRDFTASGFWSTKMGWDDLRYEGNVARASWDGCPPAALDKLGVSDAIMQRRPSK